MLGVFPRHFGCFMVVLDGCYFIRLVVFWLSYEKVSINIINKLAVVKNRGFVYLIKKMGFAVFVIQ
ncbi:hypothetical protein [uncultured Gammaproteobacteria bacterium]|nr:hypothetical protein [uncultured Gammaproteobacteria bacterium]VVH52318.1 hypothetical protein BPUTSESOX_1113 [uncultured Gammaproteobacteria bacterium]